MCIRDSSIYADNAQAFCNVKNDCFKVNNVCSTTDLAESEIKKNTIKYILQEFDKKLDLETESREFSPTFKSLVLSGPKVVLIGRW